MSRRRLIELQRSALLAAETELGALAAEAETRVLKAETRALELQREAGGVFAAGLEDAVSDELLNNLPRTSDGGLHEGAFLALRRERLWAQWDQALLSGGSCG